MGFTELRQKLKIENFSAKN